MMRMVNRYSSYAPMDLPRLLRIVGVSGEVREMHALNVPFFMVDLSQQKCVL